MKKRRKPELDSERAWTVARDMAADKLPIGPVGAWRFGGLLGRYLDRVAAARLTTPEAWNALYPQTEEAFRLRVDDRSHIHRGGVWRGEFWGKYIMGAIAASRYYASEPLKERIRGAVRGLLATQDRDGYIGTYDNSAFYGDTTWNIWCRKYTLWGLLEAWDFLGDDEILSAAVRFADHLLGQVGPGRDDIVRTGKFYGLPSSSILKPMVDLYRAAGEKRHLEFAEYIVDQWGRHPDGLPDLLRKGLGGTPVHNWFADPLQWAKAYEFMSCVEGLVELFRVTGTGDYWTAARSIHDLLVNWERIPVGGVSVSDKFGGARFLANGISEVCDTVYWNRLSLQLFRLTGEMRYFDEIERSLYNSMLCAMAPDGKWGLRRFRLTHRHIPSHNHFLKGHQCCVDNLPRGLFQASQSALFQDEHGVRIALFENGEGSVRLRSGNRVDLSLQGDFPDRDQVTIRIAPEVPESFRLYIRRPYWSRRTSVTRHGKSMAGVVEADWFRAERVWRAGDEIQVSFDLQPRLEFFDPTVYPDNHPLAAWHRDLWAKLAQKGDDDEPMPAGTHKDLTVADSLPQRPMAMLFRGPVALARDIRLGDPDIFDRAPLDPKDLEGLQLSERKAPEGIRRAYDLILQNGEKMRVCDFASAGNTWDDRSLFHAWLPIKS
jgi:uncharacterized protein